MNLDIGKVLDISARMAFAIFVACLVLLFFPAVYLPFEITDFRAQYGLWFFVALALSGATMLSYLLKWVYESIKKWRKNRDLWSSYKYILKNLSDDERRYLMKYYDKRQTAIMIDLRDPVAKKLQTFQVISHATGKSISTHFMLPGFIQPWVFEVLDKHPRYLEIKNDKSLEE